MGDILEALQFRREICENPSLFLVQDKIGSDSMFLCHKLASCGPIRCIGTTSGIRQWKRHSSKDNIKRTEVTVSSLHDLLGSVACAHEHTHAIIHPRFRTVVITGLETLVSLAKEGDLLKLITAARRGHKGCIIIHLHIDACKSGSTLQSVHHIANAVFTVEPLNTGSASDTDGQVTLLDTATGHRTTATFCASDSSVIVYNSGERAAA